jgi:hypothetical protein
LSTPLFAGLGGVECHGVEMEVELRPVLDHFGDAGVAQLATPGEALNESERLMLLV